MESHTGDLEARFEREVQGLDARIRQLEEGALPMPADAAPTSDAGALDRFLEAVPKWAPVLTPFLLAFLGYLLSGYAEKELNFRRLELETRQLEVSSVSEMRDLIGELYAPDLTQGRADATALALAAYGGFAAPPLIQAIELGDPVRLTGARKGLQAASLLDHGRVCAVLEAVLGNRSGLYRWQTEKNVVRLLGQLQCTEARQTITAFGALLEIGPQSFAQTVNAASPVTEESLAKLRAEQRQALQRLGGKHEVP